MSVSRISLSGSEPDEEMLELWNGVRDSGIAPTFGSELNESEDLRREFLLGARMMGLIGRQKSLKPQQLRLVDTLNAGCRFNEVLLPRRSAKTTTILAWMLGRCASRDEYYAAFTLCTTGKKARERFSKDIVPVLERVFPDRATRPFTIYKGQGTERIRFDNDSVFQVLKPAAEDFRSDAWDLIVADEGGEADPEMGTDIVTGALPTQDTRLGAQFVTAGTAAKYRTGNLLWDMLEKGRASLTGHAILEYSAGENLTADDLADWEVIEPIILSCHPGIGTLTTIDAIRVNWEMLPRPQFSEEYLSIFGLVGLSGGLLNQTNWAKGGLEEDPPAVPEKFALVIAAHPDQLSASIGAVWREDGVACLLLLEHRPGVEWLAETAAAIARKYRTGIVHDSRGVVMVETEQLQRMRPRPILAPQTTRHVTTAAGLLVKEVEVGNVRHWNQPALTMAAQLATKRKILGSWGLGRQSETDDITPIECMALGLRVWDEGGAMRPKLTIIV